ncbi:MAG: DUF697 domain-containing protein [Myxococcota bacterium]
MTSRAATATELIQRAERTAFAIGFLPLPFVDAAAVLVVQLDMIHKLARLYGVPFDEREAKPVLTGLLGSVLPTYFGNRAALTLVRWLPGIGSVLGLATVPASLGAATRIIGKLFAQHLEDGGTLQDFNLRVITEADTEADTPAMDEPTPITPREASGSAQVSGHEDLTLVIGIGPKIAALLADSGIKTFSQLAAAKADELEALLQRAGPRFRGHDPTTWPEQARILITGTVDDLEKFRK